MLLLSLYSNFSAELSWDVIIRMEPHQRLTEHEEKALEEKNRHKEKPTYW
jgi:hypothetical protein